MKPILDANIMAAEALLNCWIREGGAFTLAQPGCMQIPLSSKQEKLHVFYQDQTLLGDIRLQKLPHFQGEELQPLPLTELLVEETLFLTGAPHQRVPDWKENLRSSVHTMEKLFENLRRRTDSGKRLSFIQSEQSLYLGHRFHPSPKSRLGFSQSDLENYSPEWGGAFPLHYFGLSENAAILRGETGFFRKWMELTQPIFGRQQTILPVHPWQAQRALQLPEIQQALQEGSLVDLGQKGPLFSPTSSVRTLYQPDWDLFIKTSLDVRITNCFRRNLPQEMEALKYVREMLLTLFPGREHFRIMDEPLSIDTRFPVALGAIFRNGIGQEKKQGLEPLLAGALFGDGAFGAQRFLAHLPGANFCLEKWFRLYCQALVPPVLEAFFKYGIMFEPHLQNILVCLEKKGGITFLQRDLDNVKIVNDSIAANLLAATPQEVKNEVLVSAEAAWKRLSYCLIVNHLSEVIATLARLDSAKLEVRNREQELWLILREVLSNFSEHEPVRQLIDSRWLFTKMNFLTRITRISDKEAPFSAIPNPMAAAVRTPAIA